MSAKSSARSAARARRSMLLGGRERGRAAQREHAGVAGDLGVQPVGRDRGVEQADRDGRGAASNISPVRNSSCAARGSSRGSTVTEITAGTRPEPDLGERERGVGGRDRDVGGRDDADAAGAGRPGELGDHGLRRWSRSG